MRHQEDASREIGEVLLEQADGVQVEVVGRLVEQEEVRRRRQEAHQGEPAHLPAGEPFEPDSVHAAREEELLEELLGGERAAPRLRHAFRELLHVPEDGEGGIDPRPGLVKCPNTVVSPLTTVPPSGASSPETRRRNVVFPEPLGPSRPIRSPRRKLYVKGRITGRSPKERRTSCISSTFVPWRRYADENSRIDISRRGRHRAGPSRAACGSCPSPSGPGTPLQPFQLAAQDRDPALFRPLLRLFALRAQLEVALVAAGVLADLPAVRSP